MSLDLALGSPWRRDIWGCGGLIVQYSYIHVRIELYGCAAAVDTIDDAIDVIHSFIGSR